MLSNSNVINAFVMGRSAKNRNLYTDGKVLINYSTAIAQRLSNGNVVYNATKYSITTSKIQSWTRSAIGRCIVVEGVPMGAKDLIRYIG